MLSGKEPLALSAAKGKHPRSVNWSPCERQAGHPLRPSPRPPARGGPLRRQLQAAAGHPQGVALL